MNGARRVFTVYEKPRPARIVLAEGLGITTEEAGKVILALVKGGYGIAPRNPTNGMIAAYLEALTPPTGHERVITAIGKARVRWQAMLEQGTAMALSMKFIPARDSDGTATAAANGDLPVPQDCQARPEGIAPNCWESQPLNSAGDQ